MELGLLVQNVHGLDTLSNDREQYFYNKVENNTNQNFFNL